MKILLDTCVWDGVVQARNCGLPVMMWYGQENGKKTRAMRKFLRGPMKKVSLRPQWPRSQ